MVTSMVDMFDNFKEHSVAEFFKKNKQMLGFSGKIRSLTTVVHEYVTNSLDACEEAQILPEISLEIIETDKEKEHYKVIIEDNGPGIPKSLLGKALGMMLAGTKFHRHAQQRGQQGIGATGCTMYAIITTGKPIHVVSGCKGKIIKCDLSVDFKTNSPIITNLVEETGEYRGLRIEAEFGEVKYDKSNYSPYEYIRRTALVNPHMKITFKDPFGETHVFPRATEILPQKPQEVLPHPLGIGANDLLEHSRHEKEFTRISSFLQNRFSRVSLGKVNELRELIPEIDFNKNPKEITWEESEKLVLAFKKVKWIAPSFEGIIPIGKELIEKSFRNIFNPELIVVTERAPKIYQGGIPFLVEVGIGYGGGVNDAGKKGEIMRFANKAPLLFDAGGCAITETLKAIEWKRYHLNNFEEEPIAVLVNFCSVHVPYISAGKQSISSEEEVVDEIKNAVMEALRDLQKYLSGKRREKEAETKKKVIGRYVHQLAKDVSELSGKGKAEEIEKIIASMVEDKY